MHFVENVEISRQSEDSDWDSQGEDRVDSEKVVDADVVKKKSTFYLFFVTKIFDRTGSIFNLNFETQIIILLMMTKI